MDDKQHARILYAYLARLRPVDLDNIHIALNATRYAALHYGNSGQLEAQNAALGVVEFAMGRMLEHDKTNIEGIIESATKRQ